MMKNPATMWPSAVPSAVACVLRSLPLVCTKFCESSIHLSIWESLAFRGPFCSQSRISPRPSDTLPERSSMLEATCWPTKVSSSATIARPPITTMSAASLRGT